MLLARCAGLPSGLSEPTPTPPTPARVRVAYSAVSGGMLPLWLARDSGIFQKHALDLSLLLIPGGNNAMTALVAGQVDVIESGGSDAVAADVSGGDVVVIGMPVPVYPYQLMVPNEIRTGADLKGKKLAAGAVGSSGDVATRVVLRRLGIVPDRDALVLPVESRQIGTIALLRGAIQGVVDDPPDTLLLEAQGFHSLVDMPDPRFPASQTAIMVRRSWLDDNRDVAQRYIDARVEAIALARRDRARSIGVLRTYFGSDDRALAATYDYYVGKVIAQLPYPRPSQFADAMDELSRTNSDVPDFDVQLILDDSLVRSAVARGLAG